jgi:hypothetical protein
MTGSATQSRPGARSPPNEKYAALVESAGYVPMALSAGDYIELLPARWRTVNAYGIKISHRVYDSEDLGPFRRQPSGVRARRDLWEVHYDPYDISRVWLRNHQDGGWITLFWKHLHSAPAPFGELAWDHAAAGLRERGENPAGPEIAAAAAALLDQAAAGPPASGRPRPGTGVPPPAPALPRHRCPRPPARRRGQPMTSPARKSWPT